MIEIQRFDFFKKKQFSTSGNVEWKFYHPAGELLSEAWKKSINIRNWQKLHFSQKMKSISPKCSSVHVKGKFHNPTKKVPSKSGNDFNHCPIKLILQFLHTKILKIPICTPNTHFWQPHPENFTRRTAKLLLDIWKQRENTLFS